MANPRGITDVSSHFSWLRTRLSIERTLMSWMRTATALIGFGFTIFQFFEHFNQLRDVDRPLDTSTYRLVALGLIATGALALLVAIREYRFTLRYLWSDEFRDMAGFHERPTTTPALGVALALVLVGALTFATVLVRTLGR